MIVPVWQDHPSAWLQFSGRNAGLVVRATVAAGCSGTLLATNGSGLVVRETVAAGCSGTLLANRSSLVVRADLTCGRYIP